MLLNYWNISEYLIEFFISNDDEFFIKVNHDVLFKSKDRESCYAFALDFIEGLDLS